MLFSIRNFSLLSGIIKIIEDCFLLFINGLLLCIHLWQGDSIYLSSLQISTTLSGFWVYLKKWGWRKAPSLLLSNCCFLGQGDAARRERLCCLTKQLSICYGHTYVKQVEKEENSASGKFLQKSETGRLLRRGYICCWVSWWWKKLPRGTGKATVCSNTGSS